MVSTRLVPSASGFLGQASVDAQADPLVITTKTKGNKNPAKRIRTCTPYLNPHLLAHSAARADRSPKFLNATHTLKNATSLGRKVVNET